jgi:hypothetical protein
MINFSTIPMGYEVLTETHEAASAQLEEFRKGFSLMQPMPKFKHLDVTYRFTNGHDLSCRDRASDLLDYDGSHQGKRVHRYEATEEDGVMDEPRLAVFCTDGHIFNAVQPELLEFLFIELTRPSRMIRTDLYTARIGHEMSEAYAEEVGEDGDGKSRLMNGYPEWFVKLLGIASGSGKYGEAWHQDIKSKLEGEGQTLMQTLIPQNAKHRAKIVEAVDRIVEAEQPLLRNEQDMTRYYAPEEGLFYFGSRDISHHEDMMDAMYSGIADMCQDNPLEDLVGMCADDVVLEEIIEYLKAIDNLVSVCRNLP